jgi:hypothetical protein
MKRHSALAFIAIVALFLCAPSIVEAKRLLSDYTLRVHIYGTNWDRNRFGYHAFGRANLFDELGTPSGVDFTYDCEDHLMASNANEAYPAKWKKPGQSLEVIFGEIGSNPDSVRACEFKVAKKTFVYYRGDHEIGTESAQEFIAHHKSQVPSIGPATPADVPVSANPHNTF